MTTKTSAGSGVLAPCVFTLVLVSTLFPMVRYGERKSPGCWFVYIRRVSQKPRQVNQPKPANPPQHERTDHPGVARRVRRHAPDGVRVPPHHPLRVGELLLAHGAAEEEGQQEEDGSQGRRRRCYCRPMASVAAVGGRCGSRRHLAAWWWDGCVDGIGREVSQMCVIHKSIRSIDRSVARVGRVACRHRPPPVWASRNEEAGGDDGMRPT